MGQFNGDLGWMATAPEDSAYGTAGATIDMQYQQGISASLKWNENRNIPPTLGSTDAHPGIQLATWWAGTWLLGHTDEEDEVGEIYANVASVSSQVYTMGGTPDKASLTYFTDLNGVEYVFDGGIVQGITWNLSASEFSTMSLDLIGQGVSKWGGASRTPTRPPATEIITPGDLGTFTIGGVSLASCIKGATINWAWPTTDIGRQRLGSTEIPQPIRVGRQTVAATFNLELDSGSNANTVDILDDLLDNSSLGTIILDNFTLGGCVATGELPDLASGLIDVTLSVAGTGLLVTTT
ncbi:MAG: hypothetical protein DRQ62_15405 [Gammaproteobacteria bacterium]|nr:MAG: hypothetical protein DRQ62_15405 [Gammaproteobacteria bacterium]